jgi:hypothetical protein
MLGSINFSEKSDRDAVIETYVSDRNGWLKNASHAAKFKVFFWSFIISMVQHFYPILKVKSSETEKYAGSLFML